MGILIYEMVVGTTPFHEIKQPGESRREVSTRIYKNILRKRLQFPDWVDSETRDVVKALLNRNPRRRLGSANGVDDLKAHPWFESIDFKELERLNIRPTMIPGGDSTTIDNFPKVVESDDEDDSGPGHYYDGFDYTWEEAGREIEMPHGAIAVSDGATGIESNVFAVLGRSFKIATRYSRYDSNPVLTTNIRSHATNLQRNFPNDPT